MKSLADMGIKASEYGYIDASYSTLISSMEIETLLDVTDSDYQGKTRQLVREGSRYGVLTYHWGSCSGCDALQACNSVADMESLRDSLYEGIRWGTPAELIEWLATDKEWNAEEDWMVDEDDKKFVEQATAILKATGT